VAEHVRVATHQLVVDAGRDVGDREATLLFGDRGVELDLVEQVAELFDQVVVGGRIGRVEAVDRIDDLIGLLQQVGDERLVGLLDVPWALLAQEAGELVEPDVLRPDRCRQMAVTVRSSSDQVVSTMSSSAVPSACRIVSRSSPVALSTASLISDSTQSAWA
jgi:hypothetical protein